MSVRWQNKPMYRSRGYRTHHTTYSRSFVAIYLSIIDWCVLIKSGKVDVILIYENKQIHCFSWDWVKWCANEGECQGRVAKRVWGVKSVISLVPLLPKLIAWNVVGLAIFWLILKHEVVWKNSIFAEWMRESEFEWAHDVQGEGVIISIVVDSSGIWLKTLKRRGHIIGTLGCTSDDVWSLTVY